MFNAVSTSHSPLFCICRSYLPWWLALLCLALAASATAALLGRHLAQQPAEDCSDLLPLVPSPHAPIPDFGWRVPAVRTTCPNPRRPTFPPETRPICARFKPDAHGRNTAEGPTRQLIAARLHGLPQRFIAVERGGLLAYWTWDEGGMPQMYWVITCRP